MPTPVDELYDIFLRQEGLLAQSDIGDLQATQRIFIKFMIISSSSYFEDEIKQSIRNFVVEASNQNIAVVKFFDENLLDRGYHKIIDWKENSKLKAFCKFFGVKLDVYYALFPQLELDKHFADFLQLGIMRNDLMHKNLVQQNIELTLSEAYHKYQSAKVFVDTIPEMLASTKVAVDSNDHS